MSDTITPIATATAPAVAKPLVSPAVLAVGFTALRIFFGVDWLSNATAKLLGTANFGGGYFSFNLVDRATAKSILEQGVGSSPIAPLRAFYADIVLPNFGAFGAFLTVVELAIGLGLLFGVATRLAALGGLVLLFPIWIMLLGTNQYFWTYPLDLFPLVLLAIVPAGRTGGLDARLAARFGSRWPF